MKVLSIIEVHFHLYVQPCCLALHSVISCIHIFPLDKNSQHFLAIVITDLIETSIAIHFLGNNIRKTYKGQHLEILSSKHHLEDFQRSEMEQIFHSHS